jgi:hypothetical protein
LKLSNIQQQEAKSLSIGAKRNPLRRRFRLRASFSLTQLKKLSPPNATLSAAKVFWILMMIKRLAPVPDLFNGKPLDDLQGFT